MSFNFPLLGAVLSLQIGAIAYPRWWLKCAATAAGLYSLAYYIWYKPDGTYMDIWVFGMNIWGLIVKAINIFWFREQSTLVRKGHKGQTEMRGESTSHRRPGFPLYVARTLQVMEALRAQTSHMLDAVEMLTTLRAVGWEFEAKGLPEPPTASYPRFQFVLGQIYGAFWRYMVLDIGRSVINSTSLGHFPLVIQPVQLSIMARLGLGLYTCLYCRWTLDVPYRILSILSVSLGLTKPCEWPPLMGSWVDAWTIRRFWSHTWHQMMRLHAEPPVGFVVHDILGLPKGHYLSRWGKVFGNFAIAAGLHAYGRVLAHGVARYDCNMFMAHAVGVWLEDHFRLLVDHYGLKPRDSRIARLTGYMWTFTFTFWTWHYFMEEMIRAGGIVIPAFGASIMDSCVAQPQFTTGNQLIGR